MIIKRSLYKTTVGAVLVALDLELHDVDAVLLSPVSQRVERAVDRAGGMDDEGQASGQGSGHDPGP